MDRESQKLLLLMAPFLGILALALAIYYLIKNNICKVKEKAKLLRRKCCK